MRKRSDDPRTWKTFIERDLRELSVGLGDVIATADYMIINEKTMEQLRKKVSKILGDVLRK
jgi:dephospho-CoA kinase